MAFLLFCATLACLLQVVVLRATASRRLQLLTLPAILSPPGLCALYLLVRRPNYFLFDWKDNLIFCGLVALALLLGWLAAWVGELR